MADDCTGPLGGMRVLVVEDEYYLAEDLSRSLVAAGALVVGPVGTLAEAERKVGEGQFDLAVIDMNLRGDFISAVAERLAANDVPVVITTGYDRGALPEALQELPRVVKPLSPQRVVGLLIALSEGRAREGNSNPSILC